MPRVFRTSLPEDRSKLVDRPFADLLEDSIRLLAMAEETEDDASLETLSRASGTASLLLVEGAASTCLDSLALNGTFADDLDRLPVLSKFDVFVRLRFRGRALDRGAGPVQLLSELKGLRDGFAHAKRQPIKVSFDSEGPVADPDRTPRLGVSRTPHDWTTSDAEAVMRGVHEFLSYVMRDVCRFRRGQVSALLCSTERRPSPETTRVPYFRSELLDAASRWRIELGYLRLGRL